MTEDLKLKEVQDLMRRYYFMRDSARGLYATFTWFVEEVGELAEALISNDRERSEEEIADVLAWLASIANLLNIDLNEAFKKKYLNPEPPH
ncbi:MAG: nucleotide pyrophosphohydrolase [Zestosphaera tikiterensis]|uniref:Nucleotide pyrophosphohydrolase n=1 Tax=Zestosphaera tikiterensis TaxID=1973259 RepID=A0A2R7Y5U8_9CREN|nr:MAG: nucleotide pyrophosphohydrolase [Zestosphaera tikiterensis]